MPGYSTDEQRRQGRCIDVPDGQELERYNGFGYRFRGIATPYLWSGSDRYLKGKFVRDGVFDPDAVSRQIGAGVVMKAMRVAGDI